MIELIYHLAYGLAIGWVLWRVMPLALRGH